MMMKLFLFVLASAASVKCQRPPYAGTRPIGYPVVTTAATTEGLGDRFGEDGVTTTTQRLPLEANGDRDLVDRLSKLPIDKQPFWFINWQALESHRQKPQTYPLKPNPFIEPGVSNSGNVQVPNSGNVGIPNTGNVGNSNAGNVFVSNSGNTGLGNRNSGNTGSSNTGSANTGITVPSSNSNTPIAITNRNSVSASNGNSANGIAASSSSASSFGTIADRFNDGIEVNRYFETQPLSTNLGSGSSNHKPGNTVN